MASLFRIPPAMDDSTRTRCDAMIRLVENACSEMLLAPDWTLNMQIVDDLNRERDPVVLTEVIRILRKRLGSGNPMVLSVGLTLAETLVKNCHDPVHREIASERFMAAVAKIARTYSFKTNRESLAIADQSLDIIQAWGEAFLPRRREFPLFVDTYHELRAEGLPFSEQYQSDRAPVLDPGAGSLLDRPSGGDGSGSAAAGAATSLPVATPVSRSGGSTRGGDGGAGADAGSSGGSNELRDLSVSDREIVATGASCSEMLEQVLQAAGSRAEVRDSDITAEIVEQLKQAGPKISGIIEANGEGDAGMLEALFKVNDAVDSVLRLYKAVVDGTKSLPLLPPSSYSSNVGEVSSRMEGLSVGQAAGARSAAAKLRKKNVPTLSRPPSDRKEASGGGGGGDNGSGGGGGTLDLLSGFELEGASNSNANKSAVGAPGVAGADIFAGFAAPAGHAAANAGAAAAAGAGAGAPNPAPGAVASGDWVVVGGGGTEEGRAAAAGGGVQAQGLAPAAVAPGMYGQPQQQQGLGSAGSNPAPPPATASAYPSAADKAQNLMANLGALYAVGTPSAMPAPMPMGALGGPAAASQVTGASAQGLDGSGGMSGPSPSPAAWGGSGAVGGGGGVAAFGDAGTGGSGNVMQASSSPFDAMDPFAGQQQQLYQQGQQGLQQQPYQQQQQQAGPMLPQPPQPQEQQQGYPYAQQQQQQPPQMQMQQPPQAQQPFP